MSNATRLRPELASPLLAALALLSALILPYSRTSGSALVQSLAVIVSLAVVFFSAHPLGHLVVARLMGVHTEYFFVGRSDFRKLPSRTMSAVGGLVPTIGTKLRRAELVSLPSRRRGYILGAGVLVSNALVGLEVLYVLASGFAPVPGALALAFFAATLATEALFSTRSGDLAKMMAEFKKDR